MTATRLFSNGSYFVNGSFDEVTQSTISVTGNTVYSSQFDEFTGVIIVDSTLSLWLDAGQSQSYSGSGTTWTDLSGKGNHGTLQSSPTFNAYNPICFSFASASSQYVSTTTQYSNPQSFTIGVVFKTATTAAKKLIGFENSQTGTVTSSWDRHLYVHTDGYLKLGVFRSGGYLANTSYSVADGNWRYAVGTVDNGIATLYVNGDFVANVNAGGAIETYNGYWRLGAYKLGGVWGGSDGYYNGDIAIAHVYDRALTASEIKLNYDGIKKRFGI